ncbi:hypothetical protein ATANTOWER_018025 [Ataeniobius toweri]|uniref:Uncharacterized protein n=1 Tax=Ataeniobius toweri TaxID=208326 RepID=A0ABU7C335_9TELE|nr:hypothetical protein [Ataeniobius toweri]
MVSQGTSSPADPKRAPPFAEFPTHPRGTTQTLKTRSPAPTPSSQPEEATNPQQKPAGSRCSNDPECGPTTEKRADRPAQCNQNTPHKGGHMTNVPNHPRTHGAKPTEHPALTACTRLQPQPG